MSANDMLTDPESLFTHPSFDLSYDIDDQEDPTHVLVYAETTDEINSQWIAIDIDHAVDLADIA